jgi:hypothetical protein
MRAKNGLRFSHCNCITRRVITLEFLSEMTVRQVHCGAESCLTRHWMKSPWK